MARDLNMQIRSPDYMRNKNYLTTLEEENTKTKYTPGLSTNAMNKIYRFKQKGQNMPTIADFDVQKTLETHNHPHWLPEPQL